MSPCCSAGIVWLAFSTDYVKWPDNKGKDDYYACQKCRKNIEDNEQMKLDLKEPNL